MPAMGVDHAVAGQVPQPELKRHAGRFEVVGQPAVRFDQHILHDIAGVDPPLQARSIRMPTIRRSASRWRSSSALRALASPLRAASRSCCVSEESGHMAFKYNASARSAPTQP